MIDLHCDVLYQLSQADGDMRFRDDPRLQANLERLQIAGVNLQFFAIFVDPSVPDEKKFLEALRQVEFFHTHVLAPNPEMVFITDWKQISLLQEDQIGAVLTLEGCDAIGTDIGKLSALLQAGVKLVGLTWNFENAVGFGALEDPSKGLTPFGNEVLHLLNEKEIIVDVSHLNEAGFWDVISQANHIIASHSNARVLCDHPRNLTDEQLLALSRSGGHIHLVFYPLFTNDQSETVTQDDLVNHARYIVSLIGVDKIGLGSDFDGITIFIEGLENASDTPSFIAKLQEVFSTEEVKAICEANFLQYLDTHFLENQR
ncbi:dipeptidase [Paenisporosarcina cavernae]|uniref:Membrane dipeptidase n=1 Tax=Paenisporosarcina cavernae TaxID=2320858 RepID=A0A385YUA0_9BACL|nr:dipeptidase [Paenisporosarcina cavernae]AYC30455.1 membrane dipeptidase [Paenisporosarcina cavernae]